MTTNDGQPTKSDWRRMLRAPSGPDGRTTASSDVDRSGPVCRGLGAFLSEQVPENLFVAVYDALPEEINLADLVASHPTPERRFAVTRTPDIGFHLTIHPWGGPMERHRYGYNQPHKDAPLVADGDIGAVLVPALAFDVFGNRLGRGKGYYDRFLARLQEVGRPTGPVPMVGVAGHVVADRLPHESHDIAMTHLALVNGVWPTPLPAEALTAVDRLNL